MVVRKKSSTLRATPRSAPTAARRKSAPTRPAPHQNHLLDALSSGDYERVASHLELLPMNLGDVLYESGAQLRHVYFPTTSIISLLYVMADGASAEIGRAPKISVRQGDDGLELQSAVRLSHLADLRDARHLRIALAAVIEDHNGRLSHWGLRHAPGKPDFHHPHGFALEVARA
jgi:hypothetical protein